MRSIGCLFIIVMVVSVSACHAGMAPPVHGAFLQFYENGGGVADGGPMVDHGGDGGPAAPLDGPGAPSAVTDGPAADPATSPVALITPPVDESGVMTCTEDDDCGAGHVCQSGTCMYKVVYETHVTEYSVPTPIIQYERGHDEDSSTVHVTTMTEHQYEGTGAWSGQSDSPVLEVVREGDSASLGGNGMEFVVSFYDSASPPYHAQWRAGDQSVAIPYDEVEPARIDLTVENGSGAYEWKIDDEIRCPSCPQMPLIAVFPLPDGRMSAPLMVTDTITGNSTKVLLRFLQKD